MFPETLLWLGLGSSPRTAVCDGSTFSVVTGQRIVDNQMRAYYERRAREYDDWWLGRGLFAESDRLDWSDEVGLLVERLGNLPAARVLDVACGTGFLTQHLRGEVVCLDQSESMVRVAAARLPNARVIQGEAAPLPFEDGEFDRVFTSHFYGHLLPAERKRFVAEAKRVGAQLVVAESALRPGVKGEEWQERTLGDGSRHRVYKRYFSGPALASELGGGDVLHEGCWFVLVAA
jgi:SAM-dependent methyltransferase